MRSARPCRKVTVRTSRQTGASGGVVGWQSPVSRRIHGIIAAQLLDILTRFSYYEGHSIQDTTFYVRLLKLLGVDTMIGEHPIH